MAKFLSRRAEAHRRKLEQVAEVPMVMIITFHRKREADPTYETDDDGFFDDINYLAYAGFPDFPIKIGY
jgi:hypothetical protein